MRPLLILQAERERPPGFVADFLARAGRPTITVALERVIPSAAQVVLDACSGLIVLDDGLSNDGLSDASCTAARELTLDVMRYAALTNRALCGLGSGARLLAMTLSAPAAREPVVEIGWLPTTLRPEAAAEPWLTCLGTSSRTVFLHHHQALVVPPGATALLAGPQSRCLAYAGTGLLGMHFHADLTQASFLHWQLHLRTALPAPAATVQSAAEIAAGFVQHVAGMRDLAGRLLTHWLSEVA